MPIAARRREALSVSRHVSRVCLSNIATPHVKGIIGPSTKNYVKCVLQRYAMRRCSRTHRLKKTVQYVSYQCQNLITCVSLPPATISSVPIADLVSANEELSSKPTEHFFHVAGNRFVVGRVLFAMQREKANQSKKYLTNL